MSEFSYYNPELAFEPTITLSRVKRVSIIEYLPYAALFILVAIFAAVITFAFSFVVAHSIPTSCVESIYALKAGQNFTCNDPRARINIVSSKTDITTFMCRCEKERI